LVGELISVKAANAPPVYVELNTKPVRIPLTIFIPTAYAVVPWIVTSASATNPVGRVIADTLGTVPVAVSMTATAVCVDVCVPTATSSPELFAAMEKKRMLVAADVVST